VTELNTSFWGWLLHWP